MNLSASNKEIPQEEWTQLSRIHREKASQWTAPFRNRRARGQVHPVYDFLFTYYRFSSTQLEDWHPGDDTLLAGATIDRQFSSRAYSAPSGGVRLDYTKFDEKARFRAKWCLQLCQAVQKRPAQFRCFGLHEWAMVYQGGPEGRPRHEGILPLRLSQKEVDTVVENTPIRCSHFDAVRFFTRDALPFNRVKTSHQSRDEHEQPGCLHANMDLYKWTFKLMPWAGSALLWDCFQYALKCRILDMRASPYDCSSLSYKPIEIETKEGQSEYERLQRELSDASKSLRERLIRVLQKLTSNKA